MILDLLGELAHDRRVIQVTALRHYGHLKMIFYDQPERVGGAAVQVKAARNAKGQGAADFGMLAVALGFADIMKQQGEIKNERAVESLE